MGTEAENADKEPLVNNDGGKDAKPAGFHPRRDRKPQPFPKKERFLGANNDLQGHVFTACNTRAAQAHQFTKTDAHIRDIYSR